MGHSVLPLGNGLVRDMKRFRKLLLGQPLTLPGLPYEFPEFYVVHKITPILPLLPVLSLYSNNSKRAIYES